MTTELGTTEIVTVPLRISFPALFEPTAVKGGKADDKKYQAVLLIPPDVDLKPFKACLFAALVGKFGKVPERLSKTSTRLRQCRGEAIAQWVPEDLHDWCFVNARSGLAPNVVDQARKPVLDDELMQVNPAAAMRRATERIYSGCWCRFHLNAYAWDHPTGGKGVSFSLSSVQLHHDDDRFDGRRAADDIFEAIEVDDDTEDAKTSVDADQLFG